MLLGEVENGKQKDILVLESAAKVLYYFQRLIVTWSNSLPAHHKVHATNQFAVPLLIYSSWGNKCGLLPNYWTRLEKGS